MNVDIRLKVTWYTNLKRKKLQRLLGAAGPLAFIDLLIYTSMHRPTGNLTDMDEADIEIAAQWDGEKGEFVQTLLKLNFLEKKEKYYALHDWKEHNAYAAKAPERSERARKAAKEKHKQAAERRDEQCDEQEVAVQDAGSSSAPSPSPSPSPNPSPLPYPKNKTSKLGLPDWCTQLVEDLFPDLKESEVITQAETIEQLFRLDKYSQEDIEVVLKWAKFDTGHDDWPGWSTQFLSCCQLRVKKKGVTKFAKMKAGYEASLQKIDGPKEIKFV
jgi:hypothetical protein